MFLENHSDEIEKMTLKTSLKSTAQFLYGKALMACKKYGFLTPFCRLARKILFYKQQQRAEVVAEREILCWTREVLNNPSYMHKTAEQSKVPYKSQHSHQVLAFYLPQYHAFAENDQWWGKGFTEWTNVTKCTPQFVGHEQPNLPSDLGFYDLSHTKTMYQQAELAKEYGIDAFCVYYYWFAGKTLMETPLQNWLAEPELDFPLCLCWANENWTRRWDGQDKEVLIAQEHSKEDDLAFIEHVVPYLLDPRYFTVDGKPVLIVYYPSLLPDVKATGQRWREYMRHHHQTDLHLMCVQSRDMVNPSEIDFDAAIEFPPVGTQTQPHLAPLKIALPGYDGYVRDYPQTVAHIIKETPQTDYYRARGVMPGWDNSPRRAHNAGVFVNSNPEDFAKWLHDAILTMRWQHPKREQLTFINAWNEWAEGAFLEPSRRLGHAKLYAASQAIHHWDQACKKWLAEGRQEHDKAIVIHAFYPDVLAQVAELMQQAGLDLDVWVTITDADRLTEVQALWPNARVYQVPNLGRDVAPFLAVYPDLAGYNYQAVLKLHTKKSLHRIDGNEWRDYLYQQLLPDNSRLQKALETFIGDPDLGLLAPDGHAPILKPFWGSNQNWIKRLEQRLNLKPVTDSDVFVAGTMFWFKPQVFDVLNDYPIQCGDFFFDHPQEVDGSLAHALERVLGIMVKQQGYSIEQMGDILGTPSGCTHTKWSGFLIKDTTRKKIK